MSRRWFSSGSTGSPLGYEDLNDHEELRGDPALQAVAGRMRPRRSDCAPLAGKSTLNRLELSAAGRDDRKARRFVVDTGRLDRLLVALCVESFPSAPEEVVLDLDATDIPLHGTQEARFFHGYYREYCYMPLLFLIGRHPVLVRMRSAGKDAAGGVEEDLGWLLDRLRAAWPTTRIILRTDSGFCREPILAACERRENVDYVVGIAKNARLTREMAAEMALALEETGETGKAARRFGEFRYATLDSWSRERRVIGEGGSAAADRGGRPAKGEPPLHRDLTARPHPSRPGALREGVLRPGRRREPGEGAQAGPVLGALLLQPVRGQHPALLPLHLRHDPVPGTARGALRHPAGGGQRRPDPAPPAQDRGPGPHLRTTRPPRPVLRLPRPGPVPPRLGPPQPHLRPRPAAEPRDAAPVCPQCARHRSIGQASAQQLPLPRPAYLRTRSDRSQSLPHTSNAAAARTV